jgi:hypothetical protein
MSAKQGHLLKHGAANFIMQTNGDFKALMDAKYPEIGWSPEYVLAYPEFMFPISPGVTGPRWSATTDTILSSSLPKGIHSLPAEIKFTVKSISLSTLGRFEIMLRNVDTTSAIFVMSFSTNSVQVRNTSIGSGGATINEIFTIRINTDRTWTVSRSSGGSVSNLTILDNRVLSFSLLLSKNGSPDTVGVDIELIR